MYKSGGHADQREDDGRSGTKLHIDGNMREMKHQGYVKTYGFDPEPVMQAINEWREEQVGRWASSQGKSADEVDEWIRRITVK
jgi:hypothetical protein